MSIERKGPDLIREHLQPALTPGELFAGKLLNNPLVIEDNSIARFKLATQLYKAFSPLVSNGAEKGAATIVNRLQEMTLRDRQMQAQTLISYCEEMKLVGHMTSEDILLQLVAQQFMWDMMRAADYTTRHAQTKRNRDFTVIDTFKDGKVSAAMFVTSDNPNGIGFRRMALVTEQSVDYVTVHTHRNLRSLGLVTVQKGRQISGNLLNATTEELGPSFYNIFGLDPANDGEEQLISPDQMVTVVDSLYLESRRGEQQVDPTCLANWNNLFNSN